MLYAIRIYIPKIKIIPQLKMNDGARKIDDS